MGKTCSVAAEYPNNMKDIRRYPTAPIQSSLSAKLSLMILTACGCSALEVMAATFAASSITFEAPDYSPGVFSSVVSNSGDANKPFTGQDGWSQSTGNHAGALMPTSSSGEYVGGHALFTSGGQTYIGGKAFPLTTNGRVQIVFDLLYRSLGELGVGFWHDADHDGLFDNHAVDGATGNFETGVQFGVVADAGVPFAFGIRDASFGQRRWTSSNGTLVTSGQGVAGVNGDWYRCSVDITRLQPNLFSLTMNVRSLTLGTDLDFNSTTTGNQPISAFLTLAQMGFDPTTQADGIFVRVTSNGGVGAIDNLVMTVPEPETALILAAAVACLSMRRRRSMGVMNGAN